MNTIMKEKLRKVQFNFGDAKCKDYTFGDTQSDEKGILKERYGLLHCWGEAIRYDSETGQKFQETVAIVEEVDSGAVYKVDPNTVIFVKE